MQNDSILLKILHWLHSASPSRWEAWVWSFLDGRLLLDSWRSALVREHWVCLHALMPLYRSVSHVVVGDGRMTSFWEDHWLPCGALRHTFPTLATQIMHSKVSVWVVHSLGLDAILVPRLSAAAGRERLLLLHLVVNPIVPHIASASKWTREGMATLAALNVLGKIKGCPVWGNPNAVEPFLDEKATPPPGCPSNSLTESLAVPEAIYL
ncbi:hypothetical protein ZWY2020_016322 [Hordeum vulgare]|nr:hypothetical protein ZWY2020_016322 [Hordeum vulgare]